MPVIVRQTDTQTDRQTRLKIRSLQVCNRANSTVIEKKENNLYIKSSSKKRNKRLTNLTNIYIYICNVDKIQAHDDFIICIITYSMILTKYAGSVEFWSIL